MWEHRNLALHGEKLTPTQQQELSNLRLQIQAEFVKGRTGLPTSDHWRVHPDEQTKTLTMTLDRTQRWMESIKLAREAYQRTVGPQDRALARQQQLMHRTFRRQNS